MKYQILFHKALEVSELFNNENLYEITRELLMNMLAHILKYLSINILNMLEYLIQLPYDYLGQSMLGFLDLIDIIQFENASTSHESQQLLKAILPYCPPIVLSDYFNQVILKQDVSDWFIKRNCRIKFVRIDLEVLCKAHFEHTILNNIELCLGQYASFRHTASLQNQDINEKVFCVKIKSDQDPAVMEVLFSLLSSVRSLDIRNSNISVDRTYKD